MMTYTMRALGLDGEHYAILMVFKSEDEERYVREYYLNDAWGPALHFDGEKYCTEDGLQLQVV